MLTDLVVKVIRPGATVDDIRLTATYMWSTAHGLATLLLDGPLEKKIGAIPDVDEFVVNLARVAARALQ